MVDMELVAEVRISICLPAREPIAEPAANRPQLTRTQKRRLSKKRQKARQGATQVDQDIAATPCVPGHPMHDQNGGNP